MFRHPNYYKNCASYVIIWIRQLAQATRRSAAISVRLVRAPSAKPQAASHKPQAPSLSKNKPQASSPKQQASSFKPQATSSMILEPRYM